MHECLGAASRRGGLVGAYGALLLFVVALPVAAQFNALPGREYREFHNPLNPVRGEAVVGMAIVPTEAAQRAGVVHVFVQRPLSGEIVLETTSADGRFRGEGVYKGTTNGGEWIPLPITPSHPSDGKEARSRPVSPKLLSIAARGPDGMIYVARWGPTAPPDPAEQIRLYVNSRRAEMFVRAGTHAGARVVRCESLNVQLSVRFDRYCDLAVADVPRDGLLTLIRRDQFEEQSQSIKVSLP